MIGYINKTTGKFTGAVAGDDLSGITAVPDGCEAVYFDDAQYPDLMSTMGSQQYDFTDKVLTAHVVSADESVAQHQARLRAVVDKWEPKISDARQTIREYQDEDRTVASITKAKNNLKNLIAQKNAEYSGVQ